MAPPPAALQDMMAATAATRENTAFASSAPVPTGEEEASAIKLLSRMEEQLAALEREVHTLRRQHSRLLHAYQKHVRRKEDEGEAEGSE